MELDRDNYHIGGEQEPRGIEETYGRIRDKKRKTSAEKRRQGENRAERRKGSGAGWLGCRENKSGRMAGKKEKEEESKGGRRRAYLWKGKGEEGERGQRGGWLK